jgi:hypothetical protein
MNLKLESCKVEGNAMVLVVKDTEDAEVTITTQVQERMSGRAFMGADGAVRSLVEDLLAGINAVLGQAAKDVAVVDDADVPKPAKLPSLRPSKAPKDVA